MAKALRRRNHSRLDTHGVRDGVAGPPLPPREPGTFAIDVSEAVEDEHFHRGGTFTWFLWFNKVDRLAALIDRVDTIWLAKIWRGQELVPGFWFRTTDGHEYFVTVQRKSVTLEANLRHVEWNQ